MKTENEIIKETVEFYWADPAGRRAASDIACEYLTADGRMCAVGRCLTPEHATRASDILCSASALPGLLCTPLDELLRPEYRGHSVNFWSNLQTLHDDDLSWRTEGRLRSRLALYFPDFPDFPFDSLNLVRNA
jgi:hypothetical protein